MILIWIMVEAYYRLRYGRIERVKAHPRRVWIKNSDRLN
jgi:hypothetical protein